MPKKTLILIRHAHRDTDAGRTRDNGLSDKGKDQAREFRKFYMDSGLAADALFQSSPKKRCVETLEPLAKKLARDIEIDKLLDEQSDGESYSALTRRIDLFIAWAEHAEASTIVACSHGDWIPAFCEKVIRDGKDLRKGEWLVFEFTDKWRLKS
jgi:broad specificity phosphatase PhoE